MKVLLLSINKGKTENKIIQNNSGFPKPVLSIFDTETGNHY